MELVALLHAFVVAATLLPMPIRGTLSTATSRGANVLLGDFGEVVVLDWGLAKRVGQSENEDEVIVPPAECQSHNSDLTFPGQVIGTPCYMAPEQAEGQSGLLDHRTDIYGLGASSMRS